MPTYKEIRKYIKDKYNISVKDCWIAHTKELMGLSRGQSYNRIDSNIRKYPCPEKIFPIIKEAMEYLMNINCNLKEYKK